MLKWIWKKGGEALVLESDGTRIVVLSTTSAPPGQPLTAETESGIAYHMKVRSCRRIAADPVQFRIDGSLFNLGKEQRELLLNALAPAASES